MAWQYHGTGRAVAFYTTSGSRAPKVPWLGLLAPIGEVKHAVAMVLLLLAWIYWNKGSPWRGLAMAGVVVQSAPSRESLSPVSSASPCYDC